MSKKKPKIPAGLGDQGSNLWVEVTDGYALNNHHEQVLRQACFALDRIDEARGILAEDGLITTDRYGGSRPHPAVKIEHDARTQFLACLRQLGLDAADIEAARGVA